MKAGMTYELMNKYDKASEMYKKIKQEYPQSYEAKDINKYIAYADGMIKK